LTEKISRNVTLQKKEAAPAPVAAPQT
jgi:hypothetical protein